MIYERIKKRMENITMSDADNVKQEIKFEIATNWVVINGGPSSGKTTTVTHLKSLGFHSSPEAARILIDMGIASGLAIEEIRRDENEFNQSILNIQVALENILLPENLCFHDRGIPDSLAYMRFDQTDESYAKEAVLKRKYLDVFLLDLLPFEKDYARTENAEIAKYIDKLIEVTYKELRYEVTRVPVLSIEARSKFILDKLGLLNPAE